MMKHWLTLCIPLCIGFVPSAGAQETALPSTTLMKQQSQLFYRDLGGMMKGEAPFSAERAQRDIEGLIETSHKIPAAFPESAKGRMTPDSRYAASPKVWETRADFEAKAANLVSELKATQASFQTLEGLKTAYPRVNEACNACHTVYRERR